MFRFVVLPCCELGLIVHMGKQFFDSMYNYNYIEFFPPIVAELGAKITADGNLGKY